ncbi:hypothetical protein KEM52_005249 [Ascosphaera acerosa]|nr:hypothetical protein KEM52_005249 [Ascosphaera acerosa]
MLYNWSWLSVLSLVAWGARSASATALKPVPFSWQRTNALLAFGDSWTYVQGQRGARNFSFIGDRYDTDFSPLDLFSNRIERNEVATLTRLLLSTPRHHNFSLQFDEQIETWVNHTGRFLTLDRHTTLVATFIGINDIQDSSKTTADVAGAGFSRLYADMIATQYAGLEKLYESGFRNFLVIGLPILDKTPPNLHADAPLPNATMIRTWNTLLERGARSFEAKHPTSNIFYFDLYGFLTGIYENARSYGFTNVTGICTAYDQADVQWNYGKYGCQPIEEYFWFNTGHITYPVHRLLASRLDSFLREKSASH